MLLIDETFTLRRVAEIHGENPVTLQSWADKGWARITPAPGPGRARELDIMDVYWLSIAIRLSRLGVNPKIANRIAAEAIYSGSTWDRANKRTDGFVSANPGKPIPDVRASIADVEGAFRWREKANPYHLFAKTERSMAEFGFGYDADPKVSLHRLRDTTGAQDLTGVVLVALSGAGHFVDLTDLLYAVDEALGLTKYYGPVNPRKDNLALELKLNMDFGARQE